MKEKNYGSFVDGNKINIPLIKMSFKGLKIISKQNKELKKKSSYTRVPLPAALPFHN